MNCTCLLKCCPNAAPVRQYQTFLGYNWSHKLDTQNCCSVGGQNLDSDVKGALCRATACQSASIGKLFTGYFNMAIVTLVSIKCNTIKMGVLLKRGHTVYKSQPFLLFYLKFNQGEDLSLPSIFCIPQLRNPSSQVENCQLNRDCIQSDTANVGVFWQPAWQLSEYSSCT